MTKDCETRQVPSEQDGLSLNSELNVAIEQDLSKRRGDAKVRLTRSTLRNVICRPGYHPDYTSDKNDNSGKTRVKANVGEVKVRLARDLIDSYGFYGSGFMSGSCPGGWVKLGKNCIRICDEDENYDSE